MPTLTLPLDKITWRAIGRDLGDDDPRCRLHATMAFGGARFHVDAIEVVVAKNGANASLGLSGRTWLEALGELTGLDGPYDTVEVKGRNYVIVITPLC